MLFSSSLCCFPLHVRDWILKYAFHSWDTFALFDFTDDRGDSIKCKPVFLMKRAKLFLEINIRNSVTLGTIQRMDLLITPGTIH